MSALGDRALTQSPTARALEVWAQTLREDLTGVELAPPLESDWLQTFHGGTVELLQEPPEDYAFKSDFSCAVWPSVWDGELPKIGSSEFPFAITTACWYREPLKLRQALEPGIEDLVFYLTAAALGQDQLVWKGTWLADPPDDNIEKAGPGIAKRRAATSPVIFARFYEDEDECEVIMAMVQALWLIPIEITC